MTIRTGFIFALRTCFTVNLFVFFTDYEQVDGESGEEDEEHQNEQNHRNRRSLSSSLNATASTSIETNECIEPLNCPNPTTESIINMGTNAAPPIYGDDRKMASNFDKFRLLMWKNFMLQYRHKIQTIAEILVPVLFSVILILIRSIVSPDVFPDPKHFKPFEINTLKPLRLVFFITV